MILGRVVGEVWATRKHGSLDGRKLLVVRPHAMEGGVDAVGHVVAVDTVGVGVGEDVLVCMGTPARRALGSSSTAVDAAIASVVDRVKGEGA